MTRYAEDFESFDQLHQSFDCTCDSGDVVYVSEHQLWTCLACLKVSEYISSADRLGREASDVVKVLCIQNTARGERAVFDIPFEAKDAMMEVPFENTQRRWNPALGAWTVLPEMRGAVVRRLRRSWPVVDFVELRDESPGSYYVGTLPTVTSQIPQQTGERIR